MYFEILVPFLIMMIIIMITINNLITITTRLAAYFLLRLRNKESNHRGLIEGRVKENVKTDIYSIGSILLSII